MNRIQITIARLLDEPEYAVIDSAQNNPKTNIHDLGYLFDFMSCNLNHNLIDSTVSSEIIITNNSNETSNNLSNIISLTGSLRGRPISCTLNNKIVFSGYIVNVSSSLNKSKGTQYILECKTLLAQLAEMSSNGSWEESTQRYGNVFTTLASNKLIFNSFLKAICQGTLLENIPISIFNGKAQPLPSGSIWGALLPNKPRLNVIQDILNTYSRLIYQKEDGTITISPLFVDNFIDSSFNVDIANNKNYISYTSSNKATTLPNRVDVFFGCNVPVALYGTPKTTPEIFASAPLVDKNNKISTNCQMCGIKYTDVYKTSTRLYNSGKFIMPIQQTLSLDNGIWLDSTLLNAITSSYVSKDFQLSVIYKSGDVSRNSIPALFSQRYLAMINADNYTSTIVYDYNVLNNKENPIGKVITVSNDYNLDYSQMLVLSSSLLITNKGGTNITLTTVPLFSICPVWYNL